MITVTVGNKKGGVGKTTIAAHLAFRAADHGANVLLIDLDQQANLTSTFLNWPGNYRANDAMNLFRGDSPEPILTEQEQCNGSISIIPSSQHIGHVDREDFDVYFSLKETFSSSEFPKKYDLCIIDTPPALGTRFIAAAIASNYLICPTDTSEYCFSGMAEFYDTFLKLKKRFNHDLSVAAIVFNRVITRSKIADDNINKAKVLWGDIVLENVLGNRAPISQALGEKKPVWRLGTGAARVASKEITEAMDNLLQRIHLLDEDLVCQMA